MGEVCFVDGEYIIVKTIAVFDIGFDCYKADKIKPNKFIRINDQMSYFKSFEVAKQWLDTYRKEIEA